MNLGHHYTEDTERGCRCAHTHTPLTLLLTTSLPRPKSDTRAALNVPERCRLG